MSTTAQQPVTTPIPVQLSEPEFDAFILPHLSMPKGGGHRLFWPQAPKGRESHRHHRQPWVCLSSRPSGSRQHSRYGAVAGGLESVEAGGQRGGVGPERRLSQPRWWL